MERYIDKYLEVSGAEGVELVEAREKYLSLLEKIPELNGNLAESASKVKELLVREGFDYHVFNNTAQATLNERKGNCLGLPLLMGAFLKDKGIEPKFKILINPMTKVRELSESVGYREINECTPYHQPSLPEENEPVATRIFHPLEHIVIDGGKGDLIETTDSKGTKFKGKFESARDIDFNGVLSGLNKDRFLLNQGSGPYLNGDFIKNGLELWSENRELIFLASQQALRNFDDSNYKKLSEKYLSMDGGDSLWAWNSSGLAANNAKLDSVTDRYSYFAQAIAHKAKRLFGKNNGEARFQYGLAGHLYADSNILKLEDFYVAHAFPLSKLYGREKILDVLGGFSEKEGDFNYNIELYKLTNNLDDLDVAGQCIRTPRDELIYHVYSKGGPLEDTRKARDFDVMNKKSLLYSNFKKDLNIEKSAIFYER